MINSRPRAFLRPGESGGHVILLLHHSTIPLPPGPGAGEPIMPNKANWHGGGAGGLSMGGRGNPPWLPYCIGGRSWSGQARGPAPTGDRGAKQTQFPGAGARNKANCPRCRPKNGVARKNKANVRPVGGGRNAGPRRQVESQSAGKDAKQSQFLPRRGENPVIIRPASGVYGMEAALTWAAMRVEWACGSTDSEGTT